MSEDNTGLAPSKQPTIEDVPIGVDRGQSPFEKLPLTVPAMVPTKPADNSPAVYDYPSTYPLNGAGETTKP